MRDAYHKALKNAEEIYHQEKAEQLVLEAMEKGMSAMYGHMKENKASAKIDPEIFVKYHYKMHLRLFPF